MATVDITALKNYRKLKKVNQQQLADELTLRLKLKPAMPLSTYSNKENKGDFSEQEIRVIADYLKVDPDNLTNFKINFLNKSKSEKAEPIEKILNSQERVELSLNRLTEAINKLTDGIEPKPSALIQEGDVPPETMLVVKPIDYLKERREQVNAKEAKLVPFMPVKARAGYTMSYDGLQYLDNLQKYALPPGVEQFGEWCYFEVGGDSMEPTFSSGDIVLASKMEQGQWRNVKDYYVHIIVTNENLWLKSIFRIDNTKWIMLSENPKGKNWVQDVAEIKELWVLRRHIKSGAPKKRFFDIDQIKKDLGV